MKGWNIKDLESSPVAHLNPHLFEKPEQVKKKSKYNNIKATDEFGNEYDSKKEANRAKELRLLLKAGEIAFLARQVEYELNPNGSYSYKYISDFEYMTKEGIKVVEDCKGFKTTEYKKKKKLMKKIHGIEIKEV